MMRDCSQSSRSNESGRNQNRSKMYEKDVKSSFCRAAVIKGDQHLQKEVCSAKNCSSGDKFRIRGWW